MAKSPDAFRTISEVADWLGVEAHVLRFWETKFAQVKPVKRAGGRRYYRPSDMALLGGIRRLLHEDGLTIRGVQKLLRERGVSHVAALSPELMVDGVELSAPKRDRRGTPEAGTPESAEEPPPPEAAPVDESAPPLPFDLPPAPAADPVAPAAQAPPTRPTAEHAPPPAEPVAGQAQQVEPAATAGEGRGSTLSAVIRGDVPRLDPAAAAPILARARELARRLKGTPE